MSLPLSVEEAAQALLLLSQGPVVHNAPPTSLGKRKRDPEETDTDPELPQREAALATQTPPDIPQDVGTGERSGKDDLALAKGAGKEREEVLASSPPASIMADITAGTPWFHHLLDLEPLKAFVKNSLRTSTLVGEAEVRAAAVVDAMVERCSVQEACWYLEMNAWDVDVAIKQYGKDEETRKSRFKYLHANATRLAKKVERANFKPSLLTFEIPKPQSNDDGDEDDQDTITATFCAPSDFNPLSKLHLKALNQWRSDLTRHYISDPPAKDFPTHTQVYTPVERRFILARFAAQINLFRKNQAPDVAKIVEAFNKVFVGRFVPGKPSPCAHRSQASIEALLKREKVDDNGRAFKARADHQTAIKIKAAMKREKEELEQLMNDGNDEEDEEE